MKVNPVSVGEFVGPQTPVLPASTSGVAGAPAVPDRPVNNFADVLGGLDRQLRTVEIQIQKSGLSPQELLGIQLKVHRLGLGAEMVSKISESVLSGVRRLQSQNS